MGLPAAAAAGSYRFLTTPVLVRLQDGIVECAAEVEAGNPECYQW